MTEKKIDPKGLAELSNRVILDTIVIEELSAKRVSSSFEGNSLFLSFELTTPWERVDQRPGFNVAVVFRAALEAGLSTEDGKSPRKKLCDLELKLQLEYRLPEVPSPDWDDRLDAFANLNAIVNAWPYIRQEIQTLTLRMGLPPIILPVYRPGKPTKATLAFQTE